jgi:ribonuclease P protein component
MATAVVAFSYFGFLKQFRMAGFSKAERLKRRKEIEDLFASGKSWVHPPFRIYLKTGGEEGGQPARILIAVPKRQFRKAHQRNRIRRQIREAYRLQKHRLALPGAEGMAESSARNHNIGFLYIAKTPETWEFLFRKMGVVLDEIQKKSSRTRQA